MSGLEIAGVLLGTFPLIISGIEHWRNCAKVGGYFWKVRKEYSRCKSDINFHEILYKRNLKELLLPIVAEAGDVDVLIGDPGGKGWKDQKLQEKLADRLQESYQVYVEVIEEMNETAEELSKDLCFVDVGVQAKLAPPSDVKKARQSSPTRPSKTLIVKSTMEYQIFRAKFGFGGKKREELFAQLKECNERLEKLLSTSDKISALQNAPHSTAKQMSVLESAFKRAYSKSELLFRALQKSWNCTCQQYHFANLRLEHRNSVEVCFEIILMFLRPFEETPWTWREFQCGGHTKSCMAMPSVPSHHFQPRLAPAKPTPPLSLPNPRTKKVGFSTTTTVVPQIGVERLVDSTVQLCQLLRGRPDCSGCMCIIGHGDEEYHLHPFSKRKEPVGDAVLTLDHILSPDFEGFL
jgi:hypothetical protein